MENEYYLEMSGISKTFPGAKVLDSIEFNVKAGEVRALMGENGAGKSTLIKILGGIYDMDPGQGTIRSTGRKPKSIRYRMHSITELVSSTRKSASRRTCRSRITSLWGKKSRAERF